MGSLCGAGIRMGLLLAKTGSILISSKSLGSLWLTFNALIVKMK
jgi:hypothetical protein